jgi:2-hydroxychromene-2-carboxylate isomerase
VANQPRFYYDFCSPEAYLAAERVLHVLPEVPEWIPVRLSGLAARGVGAFRCAEEELIFREDVERRARERRLQTVRWPDPFPSESEPALLAATYAKQIGRAVAFSLAAFRQAFAAGRDLGDLDNVLIAAAACEMHPAAVLKGSALGSIAARLDEATASAAAAGVLDVPAVVLDGGRVFHGDRELEAAAGALA